MQSEAKSLLAQLRQQREKWVQLDDAGFKVKFMRPPEAELTGLLSGEGESRVWSVGADHVRKYVCGWDGFSSATLLGAAVGSTDPIDFDAELWSEMSADHIEWVRKVADAILAAVVEHITKLDATAKNSEPA